MVDQEKVVNFKIFSDLSKEELGAILALSKESVRKDGEILIEESSSGSDSDLFVIVEGLVKVDVKSFHSRFDSEIQRRLAVLKKGDVFGEMGLLGANRRSAQVVVYSDTATILAVNRQKMFDFFETKPSVGYRMMRNLASILSDRLVDLNFMWRDDIK